MRIVGFDVSRSMAEIAYLAGGTLHASGRTGLRRDELKRFAEKLRATDHVVLKATGNTEALVNVLRRHVARVAIADPLQGRLIAEARIKTDKIDAAVLAQLYASGFLPEVWMPDERTLALRRQIARRSQLVRQRTRLKNEIHAVLAAHLIERCPATDLFGKKGGAWLGVQPLPLDERLGVEQRLRELDRLGEDLREVEQALAQATIDDARLRVMLTITGINTTVAIGLLSAIGDIERFPNPEKLVSYFGLNPSVHQSGPTPARHGHITKRGRTFTRAMLVEAAWGATQAPGPLRALFLRVRDRRGQQIVVVATARKLAVIVWYVLTRGEPFAWHRHALTAHKSRALGLQARTAAQHGSRKGSAAAYSLKSVRQQERAVAEQSERTYQRLFNR
ncbi:IS110 family transposase [Burkholderia contaminans]|uniref:IS110 family transposase n=1 Tax=Burkholderia contaminans TaxID=488447 RepID=UPI001453EFE2|nr:IS110 family transposase [Burkholderia contaminans]VWC73770.1 transposase IS116/IS110/IS902 family protein [Burkholderia contaminans]